eukprot:347969-Alexandrium_andersonii.AAC.1
MAFEILVMGHHGFGDFHHGSTPIVAALRLPCALLTPLRAGVSVGRAPRLSARRSSGHPCV